MKHVIASKPKMGVGPIKILTSRDPKLITSGLKTRCGEGVEMWVEPEIQR